MAWFAEMLSGGDRRSTGGSEEVAALVIAQPDRFGELVALLDNKNQLIKMRISDACEKVSFEHLDLLQGEVSEYLDIASKRINKMFAGDSD